MAGSPRLVTAHTTEPDPTPSEGPTLSQGRILRLWWPLAASWLLMGVELPLFTILVSQLPDTKVNLAAYGSVVFPIALLIEAPIIMLLAASTALCADRETHAKLLRFTHQAGLALTLLHVAAAFTPLFDVIAVGLLEVPAEVVEPARIGLRWMTPWTWAIAYRRFQQGLLIRHGRSREVGFGSLVRIGTEVLVFWFLLRQGGVSGIVIGTAGIAAGVTAEAFFAGWRVQPILRNELETRLADTTPLTRAAFVHFYLPLALTPLLTLAIQPLGSWAMADMPDALDSLAAWPVVHGLVFLPRSLGFAYNEVVVALLGEPGARRALSRFGGALALGSAGALALLAATPLADVVLTHVFKIPADLRPLAATALLLCVPMPAYQALQSWYNGALVHARRTRAVTESVALYLILVAPALAIGRRLDPLPGIHFTVVAFVGAGLVQTAWVAWRSREFRTAPARVHSAAGSSSK